MIKGKASELFQKLLPTLGDDEARAICVEKIHKGQLEDDLGAAPIIGQAEMSKLIDELAKSFVAEVAPAAPAKIVKGGSRFVGNEDVDSASALVDIEASVSALSAQSDRHYTQLVKGLTALGNIEKTVLTTLAEMDRRNAELTNTVAELRKGLEAITKGGPKSTQATAVVPHPAEAARGAADGVVAQATGNIEVDRELALFTKVEQFCNENIAKGGTAEDRKQELRFALGEIFSGALPSDVNTRYNLGLQA
jgi:hypothetical protein